MIDIGQAKADQEDPGHHVAAVGLQPEGEEGAEHEHEVRNKGGHEEAGQISVISQLQGQTAVVACNISKNDWEIEEGGLDGLCNVFFHRPLL